MLNTQVVSRETIKPSSPTPENFRYLKLSLLDQLVPPVHTAVTLFYSGNGIGKIPRRLKKSLSEVLTRFYPLAGRIKEDDSGYIHVECNDQGVDVYQVRIDCKLSEFLSQPSTEELNRIMPYMVSADVPLVIQLSIFNCRGLAISVFVSHKITDGYSASVFIKTWAEATRRGRDAIEQVIPIFDFASIFPPRAMKQLQSEEISTMPEKLVTRRFPFEISQMEILRKKAETRVAGTRFFPTYAEAVTALIWRCAIRAREKKVGVERKAAAIQVVSIRGRMDPPLSEYSFGNLWIPAVSTGDRRIIDDCGSNRIGYLERVLRESIGKIKGDYIRQVLENDEEMVICGSSWNLQAKEWEKRGFDICFFINWFTLPFSVSDFGWGKPEWVSFGGFRLKNCVVLTPSRDGGIESWVTMVEQEMRKFEQDPELLEFVSMKPRIGYKQKLPFARI